jgi:hypothetical protein
MFIAFYFMLNIYATTPFKNIGRIHSWFVGHLLYSAMVDNQMQSV